MASNLTIESPNFEKIEKESGQFTADAISLLWAALNDTRKTERIDFRLTRDMIRPKVLTLAPTASVDNLDLNGASVILFNGTTAVNWTGVRAPETGRTQILYVFNGGTQTITIKDVDATSDSENQFDLAGDTSLSASTGMVFGYFAEKWRRLQ